jgi:predicted nuclease of predicted toxin-antitoxin system
VRFLIDNSLSPLLASLLGNTGHDSLHLRDLGLQAARDEVVLETAASSDRVLLSADSDFGRKLAEGGHFAPSVILFREGRPYEPARQVELLLRFLPEIDEAVSARSLEHFNKSYLRCSA